MPILAYLATRLFASKRQRRDRRQRQAQRRMDKYQKCVAKKGADSAKCQRILGRAEKSLARAEELETKLAAKGKTTSVARSRTGELAARKGTKWAPVTELKFVPSTQQDLEVAAAADEAALLAAEESAGTNPLLIVGGIVLLAGGGYALYTMAKKPKKKKKKKSVPLGAVA